jgi:hypothetical protein
MADARGNNKKQAMSPPLRKIALALFLVFPATCFPGQGWYLLTPPMKGDPWGCASQKPKAVERCARLSIDQDAPLARWGQLGAFDTAGSCEDGRGEMIGRVTTRIDLDKADVDTWVTILKTIQSQCVATDDPRLGARARG